MSKSSLQMKKKQAPKEEEQPELKGTFIAVMGLGLFILISWFIVYFIFVAR
ncbi:cytochrome c oxidase subunit 2A [Aquibacillus koreensis]|uniref:Cytochrome c oxidase subunit 2A n=1 Tax=Aquibacillus koreensis TaxID=279446 RepID=A0A9X4AGB7_9BACI|nr:cytochrome c oxidase subunit 2A [Aquibacillus koreensis]MCT2537335.1 cytochrome c oxidase subunit 2A [Aquibacillus koreensis]MDC3418781.1 cytochrome c oxidase subunit 2A [Aquibacillus koreensis]